MSVENKNEETLVESENVSSPVVEEVVEDKPVEVAPVVEEAVVEDKPVAEEEVITNVQGKGKPSAGKPALAPVENGAIGTGTAKPVVKQAAPKKVAAEDKEETVALHSTKNVVWQGVGKVNRGVNIVSKTAAEQWTTRSHITVLTPEQVAKEFNK